MRERINTKREREERQERESEIQVGGCDWLSFLFLCLWWDMEGSRTCLIPDL